MRCQSKGLINLEGGGPSLIIRGDLPLLYLAAAELLSSKGLIKPGYYYYFYIISGSTLGLTLLDLFYFDIKVDLAPFLCYLGVGLSISSFIDLSSFFCFFMLSKVRLDPGDLE